MRPRTQSRGQDLQRERCLLFVALTRARDPLYASYSGSSSTFLRWKIKIDYPERCFDWTDDGSDS